MIRPTLARLIARLAHIEETAAVSTPMTPDQIRAALKKFDVPFRELSGWETWNRNAVNAWGPVYGFGVHHTGDDAPDRADRRIVHDGRSDLPGPLAQFGCNDDGVIDLIGCGRANHFGGGDPNVLRAVIHESYDAYPPATHQHQGSAGAVDGNTHFYGVETYYSGKAAPTDVAYQSLVRLAAAVCDFHGWTAKSVIGHKEWSDWKVDPGNVDMAKFRADVQAVLDAANAPAPEPKVATLRPTRIDKARDLLRAALRRSRFRTRSRRIRKAIRNLPKH